MISNMKKEFEDKLYHSNMKYSQYNSNGIILGGTVLIVHLQNYINNNIFPAYAMIKYSVSYDEKMFYCNYLCILMYSHYFIDSIGLHDFTALDKLSDIYSIGKIIDYITGESELNKKLSFVISKATERNRAKRYTTMDEMIQDVNSSVREISEEEKLQNIEVNLQHGEISKDVEEFVMRLMRQEQLSNYIVRKQLYTFRKVLIQFNEIDQLVLLGEIDRTYSEATGYGHFENYDLFAGIAYNVIRNSANMKIQRRAYRDRKSVV